MKMKELKYENQMHIYSVLHHDSKMPQLGTNFYPEKLGAICKTIFRYFLFLGS